MDVIITIKDFKIQLKARGYAESTVTWYSRYLDLFIHYLEKRNITDLREVTKQVIDDYHEKVMSEPIAMESKAIKVRPVKRLFEYLTENHKLLINPTEGIVETSRKNRKPGTVLTLDEVKLLMKQPDMSFKTQVRDRAVMELMYSTAIRANELEALEVYNVDIKNNALYIYKGKGKKDRVVPIGKKAASYLEKYLIEVRPNYARNNPKERSLFLTHSGLPLTANSVRVFLTKYRNKAGIKKSVSPHTMRRTCATHLLQQGVDIRYIQELLGHKSLKTTQAYTKVMPVDIKDTHNKTHPNRDRNLKGRKKDED
ncbi:MAG: tyrosine-type recombinase/integrase [Desulfobacteraceae bacterium]